MRTFPSEGQAANVAQRAAMLSAIVKPKQNKLALVGGA